MTNTLRSIAVAVTLLLTPVVARADVFFDWNTIAVGVPAGNPFNQARIMAITQLAVFEAVNAIEGRPYQPYLGIISAPGTASKDAAIIAAAHGVLKNYASAAVGVQLDISRASSLAAIPDGPAKTAGIAAGEAAAAAMIAARANDGAVPAALYLPTSSDPGTWQLTAGCTGGILLQWRNVTPFGIASAEEFRAEPPPALTSNLYAKALNEVKRVGRKTGADRPQDRTDVARFYAASSPAYVLNMAARQIAAARGTSVVDNARAFALINMAISDSAVASFATKYHYATWRPETAIHNADLDGNPKTEADASWEPLIPAPCFPAYTSNHASLSNGGAEMLRRLYGEGEHTIVITNPALPTLEYHYTEFHQIMADIDDARIYGGIHYRFDQVNGARLGREVATAVYKGNLRKTNAPD